MDRSSRNNQGAQQHGQRNNSGSGMINWHKRSIQEGMLSSSANNSKLIGPGGGGSGRSFQKPPILSGGVSQNHGAQGGCGGSLHLRRASQNSSGNRSAMANGADGGSKKNSLSGFGHSHSMENVVFFDGNMLEALGKQVNQGSIIASSKNQVKDLSRDSTLAKLPSLEQGKPPAGPSAVLKSSILELPYLVIQKKVHIGDSMTDVYTEANDIIEEFKREEEIANNGNHQKFLVKRHSSVVGTLEIPVAIVNMNQKGATRHNNFALQTGTMISRSMSQHDTPQMEGNKLDVNAKDFVKENTNEKGGHFEGSPHYSENSQAQNLSPKAEHPPAQDIPNRDSLRSRQEQRPVRKRTQSTDHSRGAIIGQQPLNNVNQPKDQIFLASSLASLLQDVEDELQSNKVKRNSKKERYQNNGPINKQPSNKMLLSSQNSGFNTKQQQKQEVKNKLRQSSSLESILMNRPKALAAQGTEEDSRGIPMMVILDSPDIKEHKTKQDHKDDEAVVRIHQLERTGQASWDHNDPGDNDHLADEPSLSMIVRHSGAPMNNYLQHEGVEGSVLFSPRACKRGALGANLIEEAVILETLQMCKGMPLGGLEERLFAEPSEEINTQILFQDHLVNNFYYHERMFTHRNINQFYQNGQLIFNVPIMQTMTTNQYNETEGNNQAANPIVIGGGQDPKQSLNQRSTSGFRPIFSSQSNMLTPNEAAKLLKQAGSGSGIQPSIQTVLATGATTQQNLLPRMTVHAKQEKFALKKQRPPILQLTAHNSNQQINSGSVVIPGPFLHGIAYPATVMSSHKRFSNQMVTQANTGWLAQQPNTQGNQFLIHNLSMETDNTDLNEEFVMPDNTPALGDVINNSYQNNGELLVSEPPSMNRSLLFDFSIEEDNLRDSKDSSTQSLSVRVQDALRTAPPFSVIKLPSHAHIQISGIHLRHPLSIIGRPGTIIEIQSGNIVVDFREFLKANPGHASDPHRLKVIISETSLIFKYDLSQVIERIRFIQEQMKANNNHGRKNAPMSLEDMRWSLDFSEGSIGGPFGAQESDYGLSYVSFLPENPQTVRFPMLIVEEQSSLDVRDCYMRSIRKDHNQPISQDDTLEIATQKIKKSFECEEIGVFTEPRSWNLQGQHVSNQILNSCLPRVKRAQVFLRSCIFFNFFDQVRVSIDTYCMMEKCHMSEARNNSVSAINPRCLKVLGSNFSKPTRHCINAEWLKSSTNTEKCRLIHIEGCDIYSSGGTSILVQSLQDFPSENSSQFSVHNLKINILNNQITRSRGDGLTILNLALTTIDISSNEFNQNQMHNIYIKQVHQKSNKTATRNFSYLSIKDNKLQQSERGAGCWIVDSGFTFDRCQFRGNRLGGMIISGGTPNSQNSQQQLNVPQQRLTPTNIAATNNQEIEQRLTAFLRKYPMATKIVDCEFSLNYSHGCWIDEHWKGPVSISQCRFSYNQESGLTVKADKFPKQILHEHPTVIILDKKYKGSPRHLSKRNRIIPITKRTSSTQKLSLLSDIKKENQRYECSLGNLPAGTFHINECDFVENKHNGLNISSVVTAVTFTTFVGNNGYAIRLQNAEQKQLLRLEYTNEKDYKRSVIGYVGGSWGLVNYQDAQKQKPSAQGFSILACCSAKQSRGYRNSTNASGADSITTSLSILKNPTKQALPIRDSKQRFDLQVDNMKKLMEKDSENGGELFGEEAPTKKKKRFFFF